MRIPFDAIALRAVVDELTPYVGSKVQRIVQPDAWTVVIELYGGPELGVANLLVSCHPEFYRVHFVTLRHAGGGEPPTFCATLRARLVGRRMVAVSQLFGERILDLVFEENYRLVVELMGKHSNVMLVERGGAVLAAAKWVRGDKSSRPILSGKPYLRPPVLGGPARLSPFAEKLKAAGGVVEGPPHIVLSIGNGAYPYSVAPLGLPEISRPSLSIALEQHYDAALIEAQAAALRSNLLSDLKRVILAREVALNDLALATEDGDRAREYQETGELILAYGQGLPESAERLEVQGYDGLPRSIPLDPTLDFKDNAEWWFAKGKRAKNRLAHVHDQQARLGPELEELRLLASRVESAATLGELEECKRVADIRHWLRSAHVLVKPEAKRFDGHRVRELVGPGNLRVLYGETAEANDYLTLRVAKSNDYWLHVRGHRSAHVVIATNNHPEVVGPEALRFAAEVAAKQSAIKHSGVIPVDYTLKKYVRKPKGAAVGLAVYTHEKTLHVEGI